MTWQAMKAPQIFEPVVTPFVEAFQFLGWQNAEEFHKWFPNAFYVPTGHEHYLRTDGEKDRSRGDVLDDAQPYLVLPAGGSRDVRVDVRQWVVQHKLGAANGRVEVLNDTDFRAKYKRAPEDDEGIKNG